MLKAPLTNEEQEEFDGEDTLEIDESEVAIAYAEQMEKWHQNWAMNHRQALSGTLGTFNPRNYHHIAISLHTLAAKLWSEGKTHDAHQISITAELITDRIEGRDWR